MEEDKDYYGGYNCYMIGCISTVFWNRYDDFIGLNKKQVKEKLYRLCIAEDWIMGRSPLNDLEQCDRIVRIFSKFEVVEKAYRQLGCYNLLQSNLDDQDYDVIDMTVIGSLMPESICLFVKGLEKEGVLDALQKYNCNPWRAGILTP